MNQLTNQVEPSQRQLPSSRKRPTRHDNQPSTDALPHLSDSLGDQLTDQSSMEHMAWTLFHVD